MKRVLVLALLVAGACTGTSKDTNPKGGNALGLAVVNGDYKSVSVSLVDPATAMVSQDDCIDSGSAAPQLSMALSGDVVLPSGTQADNQLLLIDRTNSALTYLSPMTCAVTRQISVATGFYSNPHDVVSVSATKSYVTRFGTNAMPSGTPGANDEGDDLLIIDSSAGTITGRIDLAPYATAAGGTPLRAMPEHALLVGSRVYVTLANQSPDFKTAGPARLVIVDSSSDQVAGTIDLPTLKNCSSLDYLPSSKTLVTTCVGDYNDPAGQAKTSGLALIDLSGGTPKTSQIVGPDLFGGRALAGAGVVSEESIFVITSGDPAGTPPDALWTYTLASKTAQHLLDADGSFQLGAVAADLKTHRAFVTDASVKTPLVRVFDVSHPDMVTQTSTFVSTPKTGLPPRHIGWY